MDSFDAADPTTVHRWSGREIRALRQAKRMSIRQFAAHLGVSDRMVSKWEAGGPTIHPRPVNQEALDTSLAGSGPDVHARFVLLIESSLPNGSPPSQATPAPIVEIRRPRQNQVRHPVDGKLMALVDAGVFLSGPDNQPTWLPAFYIDVYPTTNADYSRFVAATGHPPPQHWPEGHSPLSLHDHPVVFVTWHDAHAYSAWANKSLPMTLQWEKAARGTRGDIYPWGDQPTPAKCNVRECGVGGTTPADRYHSGVSPYGVYDLCGNVWEWCVTETDPGRHELKGSAFTSPFSRATPSAFNDASAGMSDDDTGFRCVAPAEMPD
jgi:hypothetical protein